MEFVLLVVIVIGAYTYYEYAVYNNIKKENERNNKNRSKECCKKREVPKGSKKVSKAKVQNKRKPGRPKKKDKI